MSSHRFKKGQRSKIRKETNIKEKKARAEARKAQKERSRT